MHKWVLLLEFLSKKYIHAYCCFVLDKEEVLYQTVVFQGLFLSYDFQTATSQHTERYQGNQERL